MPHPEALLRQAPFSPRGPWETVLISTCDNTALPDCFLTKRNKFTLCLLLSYPTTTLKRRVWVLLVSLLPEALWVFLLQGCQGTHCPLTPPCLVACEYYCVDKGDSPQHPSFLLKGTYLHMGSAHSYGRCPWNHLPKGLCKECACI